ncbi:MAG: hypothetical protein DIU80_016145, partial [Chloroflexota bacterium]
AARRTAAEHPLCHRLRPLQPQRERRHREHHVIAQQRRDGRQVVALEGLDEALQQRGLALGERRRRGGPPPSRRTLRWAKASAASGERKASSSRSRGGASGGLPRPPANQKM